MSILVEIVDLGFQYPNTTSPVLTGFNLRVEAGEMLAITGPSGCGKSTLLYLVGLLVSPGSGDIVITGIPTRRLADRERTALRARQMAFVFQDAGLIPNWSVEENVAEGLLYLGVGYREAVHAAHRMLKQYGLSDIGERTAAGISGGQAQRAGLCRALLKRPSLVLADEPTGNLDEVNAEFVMDGLRDVASGGAAVLIVTHSREVAAACDRLVQLG